MAGEYHSKDFDWDEFRREIETDPSHRHHLEPNHPSPPPSDVEAWRSFYRRHSTGRFFKERRYLLREFPELLVCGKACKVLEVGCGNGSAILPILRAKQDITVYACDCSAEALAKAKEIIATAGGDLTENFYPFLLDFSDNELPKWLQCSGCQSTSTSNKRQLSDEKENEVSPLHSSPVNEGLECCIGGVDYITMIFTLSAVPFHKMPFLLNQCFSVMKPGSLLFFRDYGLYDMTMLRFPPQQKVGHREYVRRDGTLSYFFSLDVLRNLFLGAGFLELELDYCCVRSINRRNKKTMHRVWVHGKFQKPIGT